MERDQASKFINDLLRLMLSRKGSDLFLTAEFPPAIKVDGKLTKVSPQPLTGQHTLQLARSIMNDKQAAEFERTKECNFAISPPGIGRFRANAFVQQGKVGMVLRVIPQVLPLWISFALYRFESNVRSASVVGMVGAGGIGVVLWEIIRGFQYAETCAVMIIIMVTVTLIDLISARIRKSLI